MSRIAKQLERDEGKRANGYKDSRGIWTIGIGHNVESGPPLNDEAILAVLESDLDYVEMRLDFSLPWSKHIGSARRGVLLNMSFNLGIDGLLGFQNMLRHMNNGEWDYAANELLDSRYAKQVGQRAVRLAEQLRTGAWQ